MDARQAKDVARQAVNGAFRARRIGARRKPGGWAVTIYGGWTLATARAVDARCPRTIDLRFAP